MEPKKLKKRLETAHKGTCGHVAIVAGSREFSGAARLCVAGATRGGAGYVSAAVPRSIAGLVAADNPSVLVRPQREDGAGRFSMAAWPDLREIIGRAGASVVGPGWGQGPQLRDLLTAILASGAASLVLDADALNLLSQAKTRVQLGAKTILTPHPKEAAQLLGTSVDEVQKDRAATLQRLTEQTGAVVVLKGHRTLVGFQNELYENSTGNSSMAVAGQGDLLAGLIASLVSQGEAPFDAACQGVWTHGRAGDLARQDMGSRGVQPIDVAIRIPLALGELEE